MNTWLYLIFGGILGTLARYGLSVVIVQKAGPHFPWGTFAVNMLGCFLVGFLDILAERKFQAVPQMRLLFVTGFCGAFTTFSAFILESYSLIRAGDLIQALGNVFGSVAVGLILFRLGIIAAEAVL